MDSNLVSQFVKVTEAAAIASSQWIGTGNRHAADDAATKAMRQKFNAIDFDGTVVIGEGERDEAPMLFIGEKLGTGNGLKLDIAVDPLEGTNLVAKAKPNAICVFAAAPQGSLFHAPDIHMEKIAVGPKVGNAISLNRSIEENLEIVAEKTAKPMKDVVVVLLDRPRHKDIMQRVEAKGAQLKQISDGDVLGGVTTAFDQCNVDMLLGIGAAPEGVLAATALKILGGYFEGRLRCEDEKEKARAGAMHADLDQVYTMEELVKGNDAVFVATGVTSGDLLQGVTEKEARFYTYSLLLELGKRPQFIESKV